MTFPDVTQAQARILVDELARAGLAHACLAPGSRSTPLALALEDDPRVTTHVVIDERSVGFLGLGIARATRRPVALVSTSGTAAANFLPAIVEAHESRIPLVVLTADRPPELRGTAANQTIDQIKLYGDHVCLFVEVGVADDHPASARYWRALAARAHAFATGSPAGPVHLNVAIREPLVPAADAPGAFDAGEGRAGGAPWTVVGAAHRAPSETDVERLVESVRNHPRGLVVAGAVEVDPEPVLSFTKAAGYPVLAEPASNLRAGDNAVSAYDAVLRAESFARAHVPDFVVRLGKPGLSKTLLAHLSADVPQVLVDADGAWLDPDRTLTEIVACDPATLLGDVAKALPTRGDRAWARGWLDADRAARAAMDRILDSDSLPSEPRAARDVASCLPDGATLVVASSMPVRDLDWFMAPRHGLRVVSNRGANGIDGVVSTTLGAALASGGPVAGLLGDLALLHDQNGLLLRRTEPVSCVLVVVNNDGGGIFSFLPQAEHAEHFERLFGTPHGVDFSAVARAHGCGFERVERAERLGPAVRERLEEGDVHIVEVRTDRAANVALHRRLWETAAGAVADSS